MESDLFIVNREKFMTRKISKPPELTTMMKNPSGTKVALKKS